MKEDEGGKCKRSPRLAALFSTRRGPFRLLLPLPCPPDSTSPREGLPGGLLEGSCGWRRRRRMPNLLNVCTFMPASAYETLIRRRRGTKNFGFTIHIYRT